ncbi:MAG TPA: phage integrase SAM-like domain-containing protein [Thermoleophilaceae bacterium]
MAQQDSKSGHVKLVERKRGPKFYAKFRSNGHQTTRLIGRAWLKRGRPPEGWFTRRMAEVELRRIMDGANCLRVGDSVTFGDACAEWLRWGTQEAGWELTNRRNNRSSVNARLIPFFGHDTPIGAITTKRIDAYRAHALIEGGRNGRPLARATVQGDMAHLSGIFGRARRLGWIDMNPYDEAESIKTVSSGDFNVLSVVKSRPSLERTDRTPRWSASRPSPGSAKGN